MIIQFHTPKGIVEIDSNTVTDKELAKINLNRKKLNDYLSEQPRDTLAEIDEIKERLIEAGIIRKT